MAEIVLDVGAVSDVATARRAVVALVAETDPELADNVRLAVSEAVSNALLHGLPPVTLRARATAHTLRVEVADAHTGRGSPQAPSASATSGRGLAIVDTVVDRWGFESRWEGKAMWMEFDLGRVAPPVADIPVRLLRVPVEVYLRGQEHLESTLHELRVIAASDPDAFTRIEESTTVPLRAAMDTFRSSREAGRAEALAAESAGTQVIDLAWALPATAAEAARTWAEGVAELDRLAQDGVLLTPPADAEVAQFRRWLAAEVVAQLTTAVEPRPYLA